MIEVKSTQLIDPVTSGWIERTLEILAKKLRTSTPTGKYKGRANVYQLGDHGVGYCVLEYEGEILYFVRHKQVKANRIHFGRQVLVWRNADKNSPNTQLSIGFPQWVFLNYLLPKYKALLTDTQQSPTGRQFWQWILEGQLQHSGNYVYYLDRRSTPNKLVQLNSIDDLLDAAPLIWGTTEGHLRTHAVVSITPLKLG